MRVKQITLKDANRYVSEHHRHNVAVAGHKYSISALDRENVCGVAIVGRPISRRLDDGETLEILRVCTDGTRNACSFLYGACCRIGRELGYKRIITYTLKTESGSSPKAAGFEKAHETKCETWDRPSRHRTIVQESLFGASEKYPVERKIRWERMLR